ncbi:hypothetical protein, partial [Salmonella sp. s39606]|uniref:hypothetical protein n=1 Tax=Salmonella sp. s39606 TaxID=3159643 RepID=UPI00397EB4CB
MRNLFFAFFFSLFSWGRRRERAKKSHFFLVVIRKSLFCLQPSAAAVFVWQALLSFYYLLFIPARKYKEQERVRPSCR